MQKIHINGGHTLRGKINISGAKNSVVALIPAAILCEGIATIDNVPFISDVKNLEKILELLNAKYMFNGNQIKIDCSQVNNKPISEELTSKLRASYYFMGALLAKYHHVEISYPGGCNIGSRPINLHLEGFKKMGATVLFQDNKYIIDAENLKGTFINLDFASVGATINLMLAAVLAEGITQINNAAAEPEIVNVATFLTSMGAKIDGAGTSRIRIIGVKKLHSGYTEVIPDRIEAGTYLIAGALIGDHLEINNVIPDHIESLISKLIESGVNMQIDENSIIVSKSNIRKSLQVQSQIYPGFPTDLGQQMAIYMTQMNGFSSYEETIYENRMQYVKYIVQMGAELMLNGQKVVAMGPCELNGQKVIATDLRAGAAMVIAGLIAKGDTYITGIEHILRGYDDIINKLTNVGAKIEIIE